MGGHPKGLLIIDGLSLVQRLVTLCTDGPSFLVGDPSGAYRDLSLDIIDDRMANRGAPGGVLTALHQSSTEWTRILSCDLPYMSSKVLEDLRPVQGPSVLGYRVNGRRQFLISLWHQRMIPVLESHLAKASPGFADILSEVRTLWIDRPMSRAFTNLNTIEEAERWGLWP